MTEGEREGGRREEREEGERDYVNPHDDNMINKQKYN